MTSSSDERPPSFFAGQPSRSLFWVMFTVVILPFVLFLASSYWQLYSVLDAIDTDIKSKTLIILNDESNFREEATRLLSLDKARVALEHDTMLHRHERSTAALSTRTWMRFMSLIFGAILVVSGAIFVLGRVTAPRTDGEFQWRHFKMAMASGSPGLFLVFFGCILIAVPNLSSQSIKLDTSPTYIGKDQEIVILKSLNDSESETFSLTEEQLEELMKKR